MVERARHFGPPKSDLPRRIQLALTGLGFRSAEAREAIAEVWRLHPDGFPSFEPALREAILLATRHDTQPRRVA
jgi:hypothetical protein